MHNLGTVFRFEVVRSLKKPSFWISALSFPLVIAAVGAIIYFSNRATNDAAENAQKQQFSFAVTDESGLVRPDIVTGLGGKPADDKQAALAAVADGRLDAYFFYPADLDRNRVEVYGKDVGLFDNGRYEGVSEAILEQSVAGRIDAQTGAVLKDAVNFDVTTYRDGQEYNGFAQLIAPGLFLVLFYVLMAIFGNQMLTSTTEEKENRVIEMLLTTIRARTLIIGKILSLVVLAMIQLAIIVVPSILVYVGFGSQFNMPNFDLLAIPLDPVRIAMGAVLFAASFMLYTGLLIAIGAATPTAKEANSFFGIVLTFLFGPLYAVTLFISAPDSPLVRFMTLFPLTAPIPLMLRNAVGNLEPWEALAGAVIVTVSAVIALGLAVRLFRFGALEYSRRLNIKEIFTRRA